MEFGDVLLDDPGRVFSDNLGAVCIYGIDPVVA